MLLSPTSPPLVCEPRQNHSSAVSFAFSERRVIDWSTKSTTEVVWNGLDWCGEESCTHKVSCSRVGLRCVQDITTFHAPPGAYTAEEDASHGVQCLRLPPTSCAARERADPRLPSDVSPFASDCMFSTVLGNTVTFNRSQPPYTLLTSDVADLTLLEPCLTPQRTAASCQRQIYAIGDSHTVAIAPALSELSRAIGAAPLRFAAIGNGCGFTPWSEHFPICGASPSYAQRVLES